MLTNISNSIPISFLYFHLENRMQINNFYSFTYQQGNRSLTWTKKRDFYLLGTLILAFLIAYVKPLF